MQQLGTTEEGLKRIQAAHKLFSGLWDDDAKDWLSFWKANLRRAKRYWAMEVEKLDAIQDGIIEDIED